MAGKLDKTPQPVHEAIAIALMIGAVTATAAALLQQPLFIPGGFLLFLFAYVFRIGPQVKAAYQEQSAQQETDYSDDETYQPILDRFASDHDDSALVEGYREWDDDDIHANDVRLRFLQEAILQMIAAGKIFRVEELMTETGQIAAAEGLTERFEAFRTNCDRRIAEIAQSRL